MRRPIPLSLREPIPFGGRTGTNSAPDHGKPFPGSRRRIGREASGRCCLDREPVQASLARSTALPQPGFREKQPALDQRSGGSRRRGQNRSRNGDPVRSGPEEPEKRRRKPMRRSFREYLRAIR